MQHPALRRLLTVAYDIGPRRGELLKARMVGRRYASEEFTLRRTKNGKVRVVPMTPAVHQVFLELWQERRLDTNRVFLYKNKPTRRSEQHIEASGRSSVVES